MGSSPSHPEIAWFSAHRCRRCELHFPKVTFFAFIPFFDAGIKLTVGGSTYRLSLVPYEYSRWGSQWSFSGKDVKQGRAAVRQWRAALGQPAKGVLRTRCRECGAEMAGAAQVCARCGTPVAHQRRNALIMVGAGLIALAAVIAVIAIANSSRTNHRSPRRHRSHRCHRSLHRGIDQPAKLRSAPARTLQAGPEHKHSERVAQLLHGGALR